MTYERSDLSSGMRVLSARMPGQRGVSLGVWVGVGSRDEPDGLGGATHFLEHLVFRGTSNRTAFEIAAAFDEVGGDLNAFTTNEMTCFHGRTLQDDLEMAMSIIGDMVRNATLTEADVDAERSVILEEIAMHDDTPDDLVFDVFNETLWGGHPIGRRVQGYEEMVRAMQRDDIARFYHDHYRPGGIVVAAAGDVPHERIVELAAQAFDGASPEALPLPRYAPDAHGRFVGERRDIEQAHVVYGTRGISRGDERRWALGVLNAVLGGGSSSRLFQEIREKRGLAYTVASGHSGYADTGAFTVYAGCSPEHAREVLTIVRDQVDEVAAGSIAPDEVRRGIGQLRAGVVMSLDDSTSMMSHLGKSELTMNRVLSVDEIVARIDSVTLDDVSAVAADLLTSSPWSLVTVGPDVDETLAAFVREGA